MARRVAFTSKSITVVGNLYLPPQSATGRKGAAIAVAHPMGGVKEQTAGLHARLLAENGFVALAFDAAYQGESAGEPRGLEDPSQRAEDVRSAVTYLSTLLAVDPERIGALGICAAGGYVPFAAQTDVRIKAVATVSAVDLGSLFREGMRNTAMFTGPQALHKSLEESANARFAEAKGDQVPMVPFVPDCPDGLPMSIPSLFRGGSKYYRSPRGQHPRSTNRWPVRSTDLIINYSSYAFNDLIAPRPLLMVVGSDADTIYFSEEAMARAKEPKELYLVPGKAHVDLYDDVGGHLEKLVGFMADALCQ